MLTFPLKTYFTSFQWYAFSRSLWHKINKCEIYIETYFQLWTTIELFHVIDNWFSMNNIFSVDEFVWWKSQTRIDETFDPLDT